MGRKLISDEEPFDLDMESEDRSVLNEKFGVGAGKDRPHGGGDFPELWTGLKCWVSTAFEESLLGDLPDRESGATEHLADVVVENAPLKLALREASSAADSTGK